MSSSTDLESAICDLPRWADMIREIHEAKFAPGMEHEPDERDEALRLAIDELYGKTVRLREIYYQQLEEARRMTEVVNPATEQAAEERSQ